MVLDLDLDPKWDPVPVPNPILVPASVPNLVPVLYLVLQSANMHCIMVNKILKHASQISPLSNLQWREGGCLGPKWSTILFPY